MWKFLLHRLLGITPEGADRAKVGGGVLAVTAWVVIALVGGAGVVAWALSEHALLALGIVAILSAVVTLFLFGSWVFAHVHPDLTAIGGLEWLRFREIQLASKSQPDLLDITPSADPSKPEPLLIIPQEDQGDVVDPVDGSHD